MDGLRLAWMPISTAFLSLTEVECRDGRTGPMVPGRSIVISKANSIRMRRPATSKVIMRDAGTVASHSPRRHSPPRVRSASFGTPKPLHDHNKQSATSAGLCLRGPSLEKGDRASPIAIEMASRLPRRTSNVDFATGTNMGGTDFHVSRVRVLSPNVVTSRRTAAFDERGGPEFNHGAHIGASIDDLVAQRRDSKWFTSIADNFDGLLMARSLTYQRKLTRPTPSFRPISLVRWDCRQAQIQQGRDR